MARDRSPERGDGARREGRLRFQGFQVPLEERLDAQDGRRDGPERIRHRLGGGGVGEHQGAEERHSSWALGRARSGLGRTEVQAVSIGGHHVWIRCVLSRLHARDTYLRVARCTYSCIGQRVGAPHAYGFLVPGFLPGA